MTLTFFLNVYFCTHTFPSDFCCFKLLHSRIMQAELTDKHYFAENFNILLLKTSIFFHQKEEDRQSLLIFVESFDDC